jgi:hypothetical protein
MGRGVKTGGVGLGKKVRSPYPAGLEVIGLFALTIFLASS